MYLERLLFFEPAEGLRPLGCDAGGGAGLGVRGGGLLGAPGAGDSSGTDVGLEGDGAGVNLERGSGGPVGSATGAGSSLK